jgi:ammonia channel protein AmtB
MFLSNLIEPAFCSGLALFEAGLIRIKNSVTFVTQIFMGVSVLSVLWLLVGFSLSHGTDGGGFIGDFSNGMFTDVSYTQCFDGMQVSQASYAAFMMMFAIISPLLMTGGYAERVPFPAFLCVSILWEIVVYYPVSHWVRAVFLCSFLCFFDTPRFTHWPVTCVADVGRRLACKKRRERLCRRHCHSHDCWRVLPRCMLHIR